MSLRDFHTQLQRRGIARKASLAAPSILGVFKYAPSVNHPAREEFPR